MCGAELCKACCGDEITGIRRTLLFIKPETALCDLRQPVAIPKEFGEVHHETELAVLIGAPLKQANEDRCARAIAGFGVALDLTLRDVQMKLKAAGQPWEKVRHLTALHRCRVYSGQ